MALSITQEQVAVAEQYANDGNFTDGWEYLGSIGDNYADNAHSVATGIYDDITDPAFREIVLIHWRNVAGPSSLERFDDVARQHFQQYVREISGNEGQLPKKSQIERSYRKAVEDHGLPTEVAIDGVLTRSFGELFDKILPGDKRVDWPDPLGMEEARQDSSDVFDDIPEDYAWEIIKIDLQDLIGSSIHEVATFWNDVLNRFAEAYLEWVLPKELSPIDRGASDYFRIASMPGEVDPLTLDLDADGIETTGATGRILFDHNGDGIRTGTGWVRGDDGFLVLDRNANGTIDSGAELFGADTELQDGSTGADGFTALRDQDTNGDGVFSAADAEFANVRVWQDANQDGVSQAEELTSLAERGITEISLNDTLIDSELGNGNGEHSRASFTRSDGSTGDASALNLAHNPFYRVFPDSIPLTAEAESLPNMQGSGMVRSLREGASLDSALATLLADASDGTRAAVDANLDDIILSWAGTGDIQTSIEGIEQATGYGSVYGWQQIGFKSVADPSEIPQELLDWAGERYEEPEVVENGAPLDSRLLRRFVSGNSYLGSDDFIGALEAFNGLAFLEFRQTESGHWEIYTGNGVKLWGLSDDPNTPSAGGGGGGGGGGVASDPDMYVYLDGRAITALWESYSALRQSVRGALATQTYLKPYLDEVSLVIDESGVSFDFATVNTMLEAKRGTDFEGALQDLAELNIYSPTLGELGWDGVDRLESWVRSGSATPEMLDRVRQLTATEILIGSADPEALASADGNRQIAFAGAGDDNLNGSTHSDLLSGGDGMDVLSGFDGDDRLLGGTGVDYLNGGGGNDTYIFRRGDGQDVVQNQDTNADSIDRVVFADIRSDEIALSRDDNNLVFTLLGGNDSVTVEYGILNEGDSIYAVERFEFADGAVWSTEDAMRMLLTGTEASDDIRGYSTDDSIAAGGGDDFVYGRAGADTIDGGAGIDLIYGEAGDDVIDGGAGNDQLNGGDGNDVYQFNLGSGHDVIRNSDTNVASVDVVRFGEGINTADVVMTPSGENLDLYIAGTSDRLTIEFGLRNDGNSEHAIDRIEFSDGAVWQWTELQSGIVAGTEASDTINGTATADVISAGGGNDVVYAGYGNDVIDGGTGDDTIYADGGNDTLDGGAGNDFLSGGYDSDTYLFGARLGAGHDRQLRSELWQGRPAGPGRRHHAGADSGLARQQSC